MGTSASSTGPGAGVSFDPPWLDDIDPPQSDNSATDAEPDDTDSDEGQPQSAPQVPDLAPKARFAGARRALGEYVRDGHRNSLQRAIGHYSRTGMGGASNAANRMRTSARFGANAIGVLQAIRDRSDSAINEWVETLTSRGANAQEIADEIVRQTTSTGGSQDEVASQESMAQALEDLLTAEPDVDLLRLGDDSIWSLIEAYLGYEAFHRLSLDIGQVFESSTLSPRIRVTRMNEIRDYLKAEITSQVEALRSDSSRQTSSQLQSILQDALENTFTVYEGSI